MNANESIFFKRFDGAVRKIFFEDKEKYIVLSWIIFKTNYQEEYQGLKRNECYFSYSVVESECNVSRGKLQMILSELENEKFIAWINKSKTKYTQSIIYLIESDQYGKKYSKEYGKKYGEIVEETGIEVNNNMVNSTVLNTVNNTSSRNISRNISINNIYSHWNSKKIIVHKSLTKDMEKAIEKILKKYSEVEIVQAINTYSEILESEFYFNYKWGLVDFLNRKNGISAFMEEGSNKANYEAWKKEREHNANTRRFTKRDRGVFNKDSENIRIELPKQEHRHYTNEELEALGID